MGVHSATKSGCSLYRIHQGRDPLAVWALLAVWAVLPVLLAKGCEVLRRLDLKVCTHKGCLVNRCVLLRRLVLRVECADPRPQDLLDLKVRSHKGWHHHLLDRPDQAGTVNLRRVLRWARRCRLVLLDLKECPHQPVRLLEGPCRLKARPRRPLEDRCLHRRQVGPCRHLQAPEPPLLPPGIDLLRL